MLSNVAAGVNFPVNRLMRVFAYTPLLTHTSFPLPTSFVSTWLTCAGLPSGATSERRMTTLLRCLIERIILPSSLMARETGWYGGHYRYSARSLRTIVATSSSLSKATSPVSSAGRRCAQCLRVPVRP
jgi:hypothetical protein